MRIIPTSTEALFYDKSSASNYKMYCIKFVQFQLQTYEFLLKYGENDA